MKYFYLIALFCAALGIGTVACQSPDTIIDHKADIARLQADTLYAAFVHNHQEIADKIAKGEIDLFAGNVSIDQDKPFDFCNPDPELLKFRGWEYYTQARCKHKTLLAKIKTKYPFVKDLTEEEWADVFYPPQYITHQEAEDLKLIRKINGN